MTLYETLGVAPDATPDQIKRAYRSKVKKLHPDQGGDAEEFGKVQHAYDVLMDTERRKYYDEHGEAALPSDLTIAEQTLVQLVREAGDIEDLVGTLRRRLTGDQDKITGAIQRLEVSAKRLRDRLPRITRKDGGRNLIVETLQAQLDVIEAKKADGERMKKIGQQVLALLRSYEEKAPAKSGYQWGVPGEVIEEFAPMFGRGR